MLSCRKFLLLGAIMEVFFDLRFRNVVPVSLNESVFNTEAMGKF